METDTGSSGYKALMVVAVLAVIISAIGIITNLVFLGNIKTFAGRASSDIGNATLTIQQTANIEFTNDLVNWSVGAVANGFSYANLTTNASIDGSNCGGSIYCNNTGSDGFRNVSRGLVIENVGNSNVSLTLQSTKDASTFIAGTNPVFQWAFDEVASDGDGESGACQAGGTNPNWPGTTADGQSGSYQTVTTSSVLVCSNFTHLDDAFGSDEVEIDLSVHVPIDSPPEQKLTIITATASVIP